MGPYLQKRAVLPHHNENVQDIGDADSSRESFKLTARGASQRVLLIKNYAEN